MTYENDLMFCAKLNFYERSCPIDSTVIKITAMMPTEFILFKFKEGNDRTQRRDSKIYPYS